VLVVHVAYPNARLVPKVESRVNTYGDIVSQLYLRAPNKNGRWVIRSATYLVLTENPRALKITLTQLRNHNNIHISY